MDVLQDAVSVVGVDSALVSLLQVVADMQELGSGEGLAEMTRLRVGWDEACEPVVGDADRWNHRTPAAVLEARFPEHRQHPDLLVRLQLWVRLWEYLSVV